MLESYFSAAGQTRRDGVDCERAGAVEQLQEPADGGDADAEPAGGAFPVAGQRLRCQRRHPRLQQELSGGRSRAGGQPDRRHPRRICHRAGVGRPDLAAGHAQSFGRRTDDHAAAGRGRRAGRRAARPGAGYGRDLAIHSVLRSERLPFLQREPESPAHRVSPGIHRRDSGGGVPAPVAGAAGRSSP